MNEHFMQICAITAIDGEKTHGSDGVVYVDGENVKWIKLDDIQPQELKESVWSLFLDDNNTNFYILVRVESQIDVVCLKKVDAICHVSQEGFAM